MARDLPLGQLFIHLRVCGVADPLEVGGLTAIPYAVATVAMIAVARHADARGERRWHLALPAVAGAVGLLASTAGGSHLAWVIAAFTLGTAGALTTLPNFWALPTGYLSGTAAAAGIAMVNALGALSGALAPSGVGWLLQTTHSERAAMALLAGSLVAGAALTLALPRVSASPPAASGSTRPRP